MQQQRSRQRQSEIRDLRAERRDRQRQPEAAEVGDAPQAAEIASGKAREPFERFYDCISGRENGAATDSTSADSVPEDFPR
jgi:hypothetical protein